MYYLLCSLANKPHNYILIKANYKTMKYVVCLGDCLIFAKCIIFCVHWLPAMFPLSCARTAFQPSAHSIFSVPTNLKSFHYYFKVIFFPLSQLTISKDRGFLLFPSPLYPGRRLYPVDQSLGSIHLSR